MKKKSGAWVWVLGYPRREQAHRIRGERRTRDWREGKKSQRQRQLQVMAGAPGSMDFPSSADLKVMRWQCSPPVEGCEGRARVPKGLNFPRLQFADRSSPKRGALLQMDRIFLLSVFFSRPASMGNLPLDLPGGALQESTTRTN